MTKSIPPHILAAITKWAPWAFAGFAWLVTLGGVSALQSGCVGACPQRTGLTWWALWWQAAILGGAALAIFFGAKSARVPVAIMAGLSALLAMLLADRHLADPLRRVTRYSIALGSSTRTDTKYDATAAGLIMTAVANLCLVCGLTADWDDVSAAARGVAAAAKDVKMPAVKRGGGDAAAAGQTAAV